MLGIVLAAGSGTRLRPLTDDLPKALLPVDGGRPILDVIVANLAAAGVDEIVIVTGHAADAIDAAVPAFERAHGVTIGTIRNDHHADRNNAYSLWLAREAFSRSALLVNGDTVHPPSVERALLDARGQAPVLIALDDQKSLAEEEMKVRLDPDGHLDRINKGLDPATVDGEYIGVTLIEAEAAAALADALQATFERDPSLYYEDGYQELADRGGHIGAVSIGVVEWVEVDDHGDLARARTIACLC